jgi:hypothetical protein
LRKEDGNKKAATNRLPFVTAVINAVTIKLHQKGLNQQGNYTSRKAKKARKIGLL